MSDHEIDDGAGHTDTEALGDAQPIVSEGQSLVAGGASMVSAETLVGEMLHVQVPPLEWGTKSVVTRAETQVIEGDTYDIGAWRQIRKDAPGLDEAVRKLTSGAPVMEALVEDLFRSVSKARLVVTPESAMEQSCRVNHALMHEIMELPEHRALRSSGTVYDDFNSAVATKALLGPLTQKIDARQKQKIDNLKNDPNAEKIERVQSMMDALDERAKNDSTAEDHSLHQHQADRLQNIMDQLTGAQDAAVGAAMGGMLEGSSGAQLRQQLRDAAAQASDEIETLDAAMELFGGGQSLEGTGSGQSSTTAAAKMAMLDKMQKSRVLKQIAQYYGRFERLALAMQAKKVKHVPDEVADIVTGDDLSKILPSELLLLVVEERS